MTRIVAFVDDLMFLSRLREEARRAGAELVSASSLEALLAALRAGPAGLLLVDLTARSSDPVAAIAAARPEMGPEARIVAWGPHGDLALLESARRAGASEVLARGAFAARLPELFGSAS